MAEPADSGAVRRKPNAEERRGLCDAAIELLAEDGEAVAQLQPADRPLDRELIKEQAFAVVTFLGGFLFQLANGLARLENARQLEGYLHAVIAGVAAEHARIRGAR